MSDLIRQEKFKKNTRLALYGLGAVVAAPLVSLVAGSLWVTGLAIASMMVFFAIVPAASLWITNLRWKLLTAVIDADPIMTAWSQHNAYGEELAKTGDRIRSQISEVGQMRDMLSKLEKDTGRPASEDRIERVRDMEQMTQYRLSMYNEAVALHQEDADDLRIKEAEYRFDRMAMATAKSLDMKDDWRNKFINDRVDTALSRARNDAKASLAMSMSAKSFKEFRDQAAKQGGKAAEFVQQVEHQKCELNVQDVIAVKQAVPQSVGHN